MKRKVDTSILKITVFFLLQMLANEFQMYPKRNKLQKMAFQMVNIQNFTYGLFGINFAFKNVI